MQWPCFWCCQHYSFIPSLVLCLYILNKRFVSSKLPVMSVKKVVVLPFRESWRRNSLLTIALPSGARCMYTLSYMFYTHVPCTGPGFKSH
uniref:Putative secreted protein n=1 Tax=Rhipicephalus microplus TaxID=6941 RepID=A0A6M2DDK0_RHIMP